MDVLILVLLQEESVLVESQSQSGDAASSHVEDKLLRSSTEANVRFDNAPIQRLLGFHVEPGNAGECVMSLPVDERLHNRWGVCTAVSLQC